MEKGRVRVDELVLGPIIRYVDIMSATIWMELERPGAVAVVAGGRRWQARTFTVHGHH